MAPAPRINTLEVAVILAIANGLALLMWLLNIPVNAGVPSLLLAVLIYGWVLYRQPAALLHPRSHAATRNIVLAVMVGCAMTLPSIVFFIVGGVDYAPIKSLSLLALLLRVCLQIPFLTACSEELLFRHYFYKPATNRLLTGAVMANAGLFTLWHLVVSLRTALDARIGALPFLTIFAYIGALAAIFVGGIIFFVVRQRTGSFWYAAITHWLTDALMTVVIWLF